MTYDEAKKYCANRGAIQRSCSDTRYYKNHSTKLDDRVSDLDKLANDWIIYDPREEDNSSLFSYND